MDHLPPAGDGLVRFARLIWGAFIVALGVISVVAYRHYVLGASSAAGAFHWLKDGIHYQLLEPNALGRVLGPTATLVRARPLAG
ncbi:MAG: hypothetical protein WDO74_24505 [Pseudomonadota bacterium]